MVIHPSHVCLGISVTVRSLFRFLKGHCYIFLFLPYVLTKQVFLDSDKSLITVTHDTTNMYFTNEKHPR